MKKYLVFIVAILCISIAVADSYELTADLVSPGVYEDGNYYYPDTLIVGTDTDPNLGTKTPSVYLSGDQGHYYGLYYNGDDLTAPVAVTSTETSSTIYGIYSYVVNGFGIYGRSDSSSATHAAVKAYSSDKAPAVLALSDKYGVYVDGTPTYGLYVEGADSYGLYVADSSAMGVKVYADTTGGYFDGGTYGVQGHSDSIGGYFTSKVTGVYGVSKGTSTKQCGVSGYNSKSKKTGYIGCKNYGIYTPDAANVGSCSGCDIAEHFLPGEELEPGDVVALDSNAFRGVRKTTEAYSKLAAGIVSTNPTIVMGLEEGVPIALSGIVPTKVIGHVEPGDLLTTSTTAGHAMACEDYERCQGSIIGKAMESNEEGVGVVTALVMLG
jgi:hypothetical protein